jgi:hypothetical protein
VDGKIWLSLIDREWQSLPSRAPALCKLRLHHVPPKRIEPKCKALSV